MISVGLVLDIIEVILKSLARDSVIFNEIEKVLELIRKDIGV